MRSPGLRRGVFFDGAASCAVSSTSRFHIPSLVVLSCFSEPPLMPQGRQAARKFKGRLALQAPPDARRKRRAGRRIEAFRP